ncbi:LLM class flavin-dependent oxidoreductase [Zavarzinella formosa]|uniref:LLM class flavin-dependent oxidoreductase n=1 Tax=Zavarzinella formosa TaxID=360055 RepID=UPI0004968E26|nr:LLM class flavin-dependent oxidoreductase [Zavarzinella formosa]
MKPLHTIPFSVLDLSPIRQGSTAAESFRNTLDLARHAERLGYHRFWLAEHHNIAGVASAATSVVIAHVAAGTSRIRVGAGGIMLPNHAPLVIAEQFGTLESLHPGRIDLGLGRAPGGDRRTSQALRRHLGSNGDTFPQDLEELRNYLRPGGSTNGVRAIPGEGLDVPIWLLGSSDFSARLAAELGLPFAFASHFAPDYLHEALGLYRRLFVPSATLKEPHVMVGINVFAADTDAEARRLFSTLQQQFLNLVRGMPKQLPPPVDRIEELLSPAEQYQVDRMTRCSAIGGSEAVRRQLEAFVEQTQADELMITAQIYDHAARCRSFEIAADIRKRSKVDDS